LQENFQKYGPIKTVKIINSVKTSKVSSLSIKPKRFAIVTFSQPIQSTILVSEHWILGRKVDVKEYLSGEEANNKLNREKRRKVFVGGLPLTVNNETLKSYFEQFGKVMEANIVYNHETMRSRGFGFVIFQDEKTVQEILKRYDDHYLYGKWVRPAHPDRVQTRTPQR
jgi:heterogeneous nuclear ribonucleoprotein A1/A3